MEHTSFSNLLLPLALVALGVALGAAGIYVGDTDDAPGAALLGLLLMIGTITLGVRIAWGRRHPRLGDQQP